MPRERRERFSLRYETRRPAGGLIYDDVPEPVRHGFLNSLRAMYGYLPTWEKLYQAFLDAIDRWDLWERDAPDVYATVYLVTSCEWDHFYDLVEATADLLRDQPEAAADFENRFNEVLLRQYMGYELRDGRIERVGARAAEALVAKARAILRDPDLAGPDEQFQKAVGHLSRRPEPDLENCVKDAVGAVEGLARILLDDPSILLSEATKELGKRKGIHPTLQKLMGDLYAYRGAAEGVAHGKTGQKPEITVADAEFVLSASAACIVYLARLYGRDIE